MTSWRSQESPRRTEAVTALWGAGTGLHHWLKRHRDDSARYVIVDKDPSLKGGLIQGIPIVSPESLSNWRLRSIVVTVSDAAGVKRLVRDVGLDEKLLVFPPKSDLSLDAFMDKRVARIGIHWLCTFFRDAERNGLEPMLEFGTLLGIVRDGVPIPWDNDLDVSFPHQSRVSTKSFCRTWANVNEGYVVESPNSSTSISIYHSRLGFLIDASFRTTDASRDSISTAGPFGRISADLLYPRRQLIRYPTLSGPSHVEGYLQTMYGPSWRIPDRGFAFVDYANLAT